jgi:hypothetical protein
VLQRATELVGPRGRPLLPRGWRPRHRPALRRARPSSARPARRSGAFRATYGPRGR